MKQQKFLFCFFHADESFTHFRLEFRGPESTLRVRQVKLLGIPVVPDEINYKQNPKLTNSFQIQQRNCETETLRVFRLITAQVSNIWFFGSLRPSEMCSNRLGVELIALTP